MANVHVYFGIENLGLTNVQRNTLVEALQQLGDSVNPSPARRNHWRVRTDNQAVIFEALFDEDVLSIAAMKNRLGAIFTVDPSNITHSNTTPTFGTRHSLVTTFSYNSIARLRAVAFGYDAGWPTWEQSRTEARAYLVANKTAWETDT